MVAYSFKKRFVQPIQVGLRLSMAAYHGVNAKRQTIRADRRRHARPGEELQLYCGMRTKGCFLIGKARCTSVKSISLYFDDIHPRIRISGSCYRGDLSTFARADGFCDWKEMREFWENNHAMVMTFHGMLVEWEPLS